MASLQSLPTSTVGMVDDNKKPSKDWYNWLKSLYDYVSQSGKEADLGTGSSTVTLNIQSGPKQKIINNAAFTIAAPSAVGNCELRIVNGASAGAITFSGFTKKYTSDALDTTNAHQFIVRVWSYGAAGADYEIKARQ